MDKNRYWYFITERALGDKVELHPRHIMNAADGEPEFKRICVAPTAAHCMSAIGLNGGSVLNVYRTKRKCMGIAAHDVPDSRMTKEHWRRRSTMFVKVAELTMPERVTWTWGPRGCGPDDYGYDEQVRNKRMIKEWLARKGDRRLYIISEANQPWEMEKDVQS